MKIDAELYEKAKEKANIDFTVDMDDPHNYKIMFADATAMTMREPVKTLGDVVAVSGASLELGFYIGLRYAELEKEKSQTDDSPGQTASPV
jgi:hypothetical protein